MPNIFCFKSFFKEITFLKALIILLSISGFNVFSQSSEVTERGVLNGNSEVFGFVYRDLNNNANFDSGIDILLDNIDVIVSSNSFTISVDTDNQGRWFVDNLPEGDITVSVDLSDIEACFEQTQGVEIQNMTITQNSSTDAGGRGYYFELPESSCKDNIEILLSNSQGNSLAQVSVLDLINDSSFCPEYVFYSVSYTNAQGEGQEAFLKDQNDDELINEDDLIPSSFINFNCDDIGDIELIVTTSINTIHLNTSVDCIVNAIIVDTEPPLLISTSIDDITRQCPIQDESELFSIMSELGISRPVANDNCDGQILGSPNVDFPIDDVTTIEWFFIDSSNNTSIDTLTQNITVQDTEPPVFGESSLEPLVSSCTINSIKDLASLFPSGNLPIATDNCDGNVPGTLKDSSIFPIESNIDVQWIFKDTSGNESSSTLNQSIVIRDEESPIALCRNIEITLDENGTAILEATQVNNGSTDNCSTLNYLINGETSITFDCNSIGENIVTLEVSDDSEHSENSFCEAVITVVDNVIPSPDQTNNYPEINSNCPILNFDDLKDLMTSQGIAIPLAIDNCSSEIDAVIDASFFPINLSNIIPWQFIDESGNVFETQPVQSIKIEIPASFELICKNSVEVFLDDTSGSAVINGIDLIDMQAMSPKNICHIEDFIIEGVDLFDCSDIDIEHNVNVIAKGFDDSELGSCSSRIIVLDRVNPTAVCRDISVELNQSGTIQITPDMVDGGSFDNCEILSYELSQSTFNDTGDYIVTLTVTDTSNNSDSCDLRVTVLENSDYIVGGHVYYDVNGNGSQEISEPNLINRLITITDSSGVLVSEIVTNDFGDWSYVSNFTGSLNILIDDSGIESYETSQGQNPILINAQKGSQDFIIVGFHDAITPITNFIDLNGHVYFDANGNGIQENNEANALNRLVYISNTNNVDLSVNTNLSGDWSISGMYEGDSTSINIENSDLQDFKVTQGINPNILNLDQAKDYSKLEEFNLIVGFHNPDNFANNISVSGHVYFDTNGNGNKDLGEASASDISISVTTASGIEKQVVTNSFGNWSLVSMESGETDFEISQIGIENFITTQGNNPWSEILLNNTNYNYTIGFYDPEANPDNSVDISGKVYKDVNGNGVQDTNEPNLVNHLVTITDNNGIDRSVQTDESGIWLINGLPEGNSIININEDDLSGLIISQGQNPNTLILDNNNDYILNSTFNLIVGYNDPNILDVGTLNGHLFIDKDCDGEQGVGDPNLVAGIPITIIDSAGNPSIVFTDDNGNWSILVAAGPTSSEIVIFNSVFSLYDYSLNQDSENPITTNVIEGIDNNIPSIGFCPNSIELAEISGLVYFDDNANGIYDSCESPVSDYEFIISDGFADYNIKTSQTGEWSLTVEAGDAIIDYDINTHFLDYYITQSESVILLNTSDGDNINLDDLGVFIKSRAPYEVRGQVYNDSNTNGLIDENEVGLSAVLVDVSVKLLDGSNYSEKITTDTFGEWSIRAPLGSVTSTILFENALDESQITQTQGSNPTTTNIDTEQICSASNFIQEPDGLFTGLKVFNAMSPNDDGINDLFEIVGVENYPKNNLVITNRWGVEVYNVDGYGTNGKLFKGISEGRISILSYKKLPKGTYYYFFKYEIEGVIKEIQGFLNIN
jgi:gliding motility-associated-like protein